MLCGTALLLLIAQVNPSLTPQPAAKPTLPKIDENACPFEGCQFGKWTATEPVEVYSTWKAERKPVGMIKKGDVVTALTGINIIFEPSEVLVTSPMPDYGLNPGDTVYGYMNLGEGFFNAWFKGTWVEEFDGTTIADAGCNRGCTAKLVKEGRAEWWVQVKTSEGLVGWSKETDRFDGKDALARLLPQPSAPPVVSAPKRRPTLL